MNIANQTRSPLLPHAPDAEKAVLGAVLRDGGTLHAIADRLEAEHFFRDAHQRIFTSFLELYKKDISVDIVTVVEQLKKQNIEEKDYLGNAYLVEVTEDCPVTQNIEHYADIVRQNYFMRQVIYTCQDTIKKAQTHQGEPGTFFEDVERTILEISKTRDKKGLISGEVALEDTIEEIQKHISNEGNVTGVETGFIELDELIGGWQPSDLIILAARPGMGKTAFVLNSVFNAMKAGKKVAFFTLEMPYTQLMARILSASSKVDSTRLRRGDLSEEEMDRLMEGYRVIKSVEDNIWIDETGSITLMELRSRARRKQKESGLDMICIDYLQLMSGSGSKRETSREREISEISMGLKSLAKELNVPVIALSQLNRGPDARPDKRPRMSDLRESGSIEQDADMIFFIYRDEFYNPGSDRTGIAELIAGKNRHGATKTMELAFQPNFVSFQNLMPQ